MTWDIHTESLLCNDLRHIQTESLLCNDLRHIHTESLLCNDLIHIHTESLLCNDLRHIHTAYYAMTWDIYIQRAYCEWLETYTYRELTVQWLGTYIQRAYRAMTWDIYIQRAYCALPKSIIHFVMVECTEIISKNTELGTAITLYQLSDFDMYIFSSETEYLSI